MVKERDFEAEKIKIIGKIKISNFAFMFYDHFPTRNGSKLTIVS